MVAPTKSHLRAVSNLVLEDFLLEFKNKAPPQELIEQEESKDGQPAFNLVGHVTAKGQAYVDAKRVVEISLEEEIETLLAQKTNQEQILVNLGKNKSKFEAMIMEVVHGFTS